MSDNLKHFAASTVTRPPSNGADPRAETAPIAPVANGGARAGGAEGAAQASSHLALPPVTDRGGFAPTLLSTSVFFICFAVALTVTLYLLWPFAPSAAEGAAGRLAPWGQIDPWWDDWKPILAPALGALVAFVAACLFALIHREYTRPDRVDPEIYGELRTRLESLDTLLPVLCPDGEEPAICEQETPVACRASCREAWARRDFIAAELRSRGGARWVLGVGYIDLYRQLHAAQAALYLVQSSADVVANALYDSLRLDGATAIPNWKTLRDNLHNALPLVGGSGVRVLTAPPAAAAAPPPAISPAPPAEQAIGRAVLRDIRCVISEFRDGERANLVRARNKLAWTGTLTALAAYALLALAILRSALPVAVVTGVGYFVVGATVGLFNQLRTDWNRETGEEDFGFHRARLFYTPVLSGLAAVGGVVVVTLLMEATTFGGGIDQAPTLEEVFNLEIYPQGLIVAAVFGLTPDLLVDRLASKANEYRASLSSTAPVSSGASSEG